VFIDTRPEFVGHNMSGTSAYWFQDGIHPTQPGADAIAQKVWRRCRVLHRQVVDDGRLGAERFRGAERMLLLGW
jgi:hypothetical protein